MVPRTLNIFATFIISTKQVSGNIALSTSNSALSTVLKISVQYIQSVLRTQLNISYHKSSSNFPGEIPSAHLQLHDPFGTWSEKYNPLQTNLSLRALAQNRESRVKSETLVKFFEFFSRFDFFSACLAPQRKAEFRM